MESWKSLIQAIDTLDDEKKSFVIEQFCESVLSNFEISVQELRSSLLLGNTQTLIALKLLTRLKSVPTLTELLDLVGLVDCSSEIFNLACQCHHSDFLSSVLIKSYEFPVNIQENILNALTISTSPSESDTNSLIIAISNIIKYSETNADISLNLHHRAGSKLLSSSPHLIPSYFSHPYFSSIPTISKELVHYLDQVPFEFLKNTEKQLESELLDKDLYVRRNAMILLKKKNRFEGSEKKWEIFWDIFECLENYNKSMISGLWKRVYLLFEWDIEKVKILFRRGQIHENLTVRRFIAKNYLKQNHFDCDFTVNMIVEYLADPGLYSDSMELVGKSKFGELITSFFIKFISSIQDSVGVARQVIKNCFDLVQFQVAFKYFVEAIWEVFTDDMVDQELINKAYDVTLKQITQLTAFQRYKAQKLLQKIVEVNDNRFGIDKIRVAVKLPFVSSVKVNEIEMIEICKQNFELLGQGKSLNLTFEELGYLFATIFNRDSMKMCLGLITSLQSVNRNSYLKVEDIKSWVLCLYFIVKNLNRFNRESILHYVESILDELFCFTLSISDFELIKNVGRLLKHLVKNGKQNLIHWSLSKLVVLTSKLTVPNNSSVYPLLTLVYNVSKASLAYKTADFSSVFTNLSETLKNTSEKSVPRDSLYATIELKWKTLALTSEFSQVNLYEYAVDQLDSTSLRMIEDIFDTLSNNLKYSTPDLHRVLEKAWGLVLETKNDAPLSIIFSFARLAFNAQTLFLTSTPGLLTKVLEKGKDRWGLVRVVLYQFIPLWTQHPESLALYTDCIFMLSYYEEPRAEDADFLVPCIFALINTPKPHIKGDLYSLRSQYIRVLILKTVNSVRNETFLESLLKKTVQGLQEVCQDRGEFPNSWVYKKKIRMGQLLCTLASWCSTNCELNTLSLTLNTLNEILKIAFVHSARQYIERFIIIILLKHPSLSSIIQVDYDMRAQLASSYILILGSVMVFSNNPAERNRIFSIILPFMISNTAHVRRMAHFVIFKLIEKFPEFKTQSAVFQFLLNNKECQKMMQKVEKTLISFESFTECNIQFVLSGYFSEFDEVVHDSLVSEIDQHCKHLLEVSDADNYAELWKEVAKEIEGEYLVKHNFQRKVEDTPALVELRTRKGVQKRHELIIVASLIDKLPNLAGLTRTAEVFNLQMITVSVKNILNDSEFKSMAVTADKWLPMMEVPKPDLELFIKLYRSKGYKIIGLEQTGNSITIEKYPFSSKSVLVLGHEKDGIPSELLGLLDACLEIPQFGLIRSLNVHVSASICIWEYMKQLYL